MIWENQTNQIQYCMILIIIVFLSLWIKKGDYVSFYKQDKNGDLYTTRKTQNVYQ